MYGLRVDYFPFRISPVFIQSALFGEKDITQNMLIKAFMKYVSDEDKQCLNKMLNEYSEDGEDELVDVLDSYKCY